MEERRKPKVSVIVPAYNVSTWIDKALDSIPEREDIEVLILDDCSTDGSFEKVMKFRNRAKVYSSFYDVKVFRHDVNMGITDTINDLYDKAQGEYLYQLDPDDCLITEEWLKAYEQLDGTDMVFVDAITCKNVKLDKPNEGNHNRCAAWFYFLKRDYLGGVRRVHNCYGGDYEMYLYLISQPHTSKFTGLCAYWYNYPREGSITWGREHGK